MDVPVVLGIAATEAFYGDLTRIYFLEVLQNDTMKHLSVRKKKKIFYRGAVTPFNL